MSPEPFESEPVAHAICELLGAEADSQKFNALCHTVLDAWADGYRRGERAVCSDINERVGRLERRATYREALTEKLIDCALDSDAAGRPDGALANTALLLRQVIAQDHAT